MPIVVQNANGDSFSLASPAEFEQRLGVKYLPHLAFIDEKTQMRVEKRVAKALGKGWITPHQKWLGQYYAKGIRNPSGLDLTIRWIDERIGYGVCTNRDIPAQAYIGEYTGVLRRRRFFGRWQNHYCFSYNIGEARHTPYTIDAEKQGNYTRFINHSEEKNLEAASVYCDGLMHIIFYALVPIPAHTQLCYDYGPDYWKKRRKPIQLT